MSDIEQAIEEAYRQRLRQICAQYFDASIYDSENGARLFRIGIQKAQQQRDRALQLIKE